VLVVFEGIREEACWARNGFASSGPSRSMSSIAIDTTEGLREFVSAASSEGCLISARDGGAADSSGMVSVGVLLRRFLNGMLVSLGSLRSSRGGARSMAAVRLWTHWRNVSISTQERRN
jgi:hypothetical protein